MGGGRRLHNGTAQRGRRGGGAAGEQEGNGHLQEGAEEGVARGVWQGEVRHYLGCRVEEWRFPGPTSVIRSLLMMPVGSYDTKLY